MVSSLKTQQGFSLLELLLVFAISALVILLASRYYTTVNLANQIHTTVININTVRQAGQSWWEDNNHTYAGITQTQTLIDAGYLSLNDSTTPWSLPIDVTGQGASQFLIAIKKMPKTACNNLADKINSLAPGAALCSAVDATTSDFAVCSAANAIYINCSPQT